MATTALLIIHGLVAVALLGAITHQTLSAWAPVNARPGSFVGRFRTVPPAAFANAVVVLYLAAAVLGALIYLDFRVDVRPTLEQAGHWQVLGFFDLKEHFVAIGLALLPAYWICWRQQSADDVGRTRAALTAILAFIVWWSFLIGHIVNNVRGFGSGDPHVRWTPATVGREPRPSLGRNALRVRVHEPELDQRLKRRTLDGAPGLDRLQHEQFLVRESSHVRRIDHRACADPA